ncbi:glycoside hydrolase family 2 TIM barrel-domain containing protein [Microbacterium pumilum]|uniref:Glycoside hydrolase family 2 TIM barrel-domain containing protein n=1 Tax=Microbacterium pumilum TaxID=344165 RepID=A0ABN2S5H2_9MICO
MRPEVRATAQDGSYPRPQLVRPQWFDLGGAWDFAFDEDVRAGAATGIPDEFPTTIIVPYPPESPLSGINDTGYHGIVWYRRSIAEADLENAGHAEGRTLLLHFGAVDYRADVWIGGRHAASHEGGHTPFSVEVPAFDGEVDIVVRAEDDPHDLTQPRGKQDWELEPHAIWYHRTTGIWQPVWLESVPQQHLTRVAWRPDIRDSSVRLTLELGGKPTDGTRANVTLQLGAVQLADVSVAVADAREEITISIPAVRNGEQYDHLLWSPEHPNLIDARIELVDPDGSDVVASYFGLRSVGTAGGRFLLNGRPYPIAGVLSQGYWPQSHLASPTAAALRTEVELIKALGFTTARLHQKIEDPRLLYWADRLGLLVWTEMPSAIEFSDATVTRVTREWTDVIRRDSSHPCVVAWVPLNESWSVRYIAVDVRQQNFARSLYRLTRALDDTRLVISNDGWEHTRSDLFTIHDYENDRDRLQARYETPDAIAATVDGISTNGHAMLVGTAAESAVTASAPVVLSEFGGVSFAPDDGSNAWGYRLVQSPADLDRHLSGLFAALHASSALAGWVYTQLTDTVQETNGLTDENRVPKLPAARIRAIVRGADESAR